MGLSGKVLTTEIEIPAEELSAGPRGYRVHVVDYDTSTDIFYAPQAYDPVDRGCYTDPFKEMVDEGRIDEVLTYPGFHAQNVYAIVMRTLARFEFALGRRVSWGFSGHQIYVAPHAFADANAFYTEEDQALAFGYFRVRTDEGESKPIFSCLSHDVVAHETTHALLDGLRERYTAPSSPEQAGFHEGFADLVAILSVFSLKDVVRTILLSQDETGQFRETNRVPVKFLTIEYLKGSVLLGLAEQMGSEMSGVRGSALRRSANLEPLKTGETPYLERGVYKEPHKCGELLVAAMMNVFLQVWNRRLEKYIENRTDVDVSLVVDEGAASADHLLTMAIRALDYMPPTDIRFCDYLCALLTSDREMVPDDSKYGYREKLKNSFLAYGVKPPRKADDGGYWNTEDDDFRYDGTHFNSMLQDPNEIFRFIWDNRFKLKLESEEEFLGKAYMKVQSVRSCMRVGPDGFIVRETVAEYIQMSTLRFEELGAIGITGIKVDIPADTEITLYGGGTLIFDEYGQLKYHIRNSIFSRANQPRRIEYLWRYGYISNTAFTQNIFSRMHLNRVLSSEIDYTEGF
jgi:hypothetical protein